MFCVPVASEAQVAVGEKVDHRLSVNVPADPPPPNVAAPAVSVRQADVVSFAVSSPVEGAVGVHGLSTITPVYPEKPVDVTFRAAFTGRFSLHFHGIDGSHFEVANIEVAANQRADRPVDDKTRPMH